MSEKHKKLIRLAIWLLRKKLGDAGSGANIHFDVTHSGNPVTQYLAKKINEASEMILYEEYQRNTVRELGELLLWIVSKDTGYRDVFFRLINDVLADSDELLKLLEPYVKDVDEFYVNVWSKTKMRTKEKKKKGEIPKHAMSEAEEVFTPTIQAKKLKKY